MKLRAIGIGILKIILGLLILLFAAHAIWNVAAGRKLAAARQRIAAAGLPVRPEQIIPPPAADADNAAPILKRAFLLMQPGWPNVATNSVEILTETDIGALSTEQKDGWRAKLAAPPYAEILDLAVAASRKPRCDFQLKYSDGLTMLLPHLAQVRGLAHLLALRARLEADAGRPAEAIADFRALLRLAALGDEEPVLVSHMVSMAMARMALDTLQAMMWAQPEAAWPADELVGLAGDLRQIEGRRVSSWEKAIDGERLFIGSYVLDKLISGEQSWSDLMFLSDAASTPRPWYRGALSYLMRPLLKHGYANYLGRIVALRQIGGMPWVESRGRWNELEQGIPKWDIVSRLALPALSSVMLKYDELQGGCQVAQLGLAVEQHKRQHGGYPASLEEMAEMPNDPFTGNAYIYRHDGNGFRIYSPGADGEDNGGTARDPKKPSGKSDIVWSSSKP